jgi:GH3 auxin-responsive promoter.
MKLLPDCGVYFEFVPFDEDNFDENGELRNDQPKSLSLSEVETGVHYALLLCTVAGAWRYLLGDTVQFTDVEKAELRITGRTKQFLSACGEHVSIDNLCDAVKAVDERLKAGIGEFTVTSRREGSFWAHHWYIAAENKSLSAEALAHALDEELCRLNDDYAVERRYALRNVRAELLPNQLFLDWLGQKGKLNGQAKIPRVLKGAQLDDFEAFLKN